MKNKAINSLNRSENRDRNKMSYKQYNHRVLCSILY